jgi:hypothetical protein
MRQTGKTPKYVAVRTMDGDFPKYNCCLFTDADSTIDDIQDFMEKGKAIANGKTIQAGWDTSQMCLEDILRGASQFNVKEKMTLNGDENGEKLEMMRRHLSNVSRNDLTSVHQRSLFVSKTR